jgi:hypothetical protein
MKNLKLLSKILSIFTLLVTIIMMLVLYGLLPPKFLFISAGYCLLYIVYMKIFEPNSNFFKKWY